MQPNFYPTASASGSGWIGDGLDWLRQKLLSLKNIQQRQPGANPLFHGIASSEGLPNPMGQIPLGQAGVGGYPLPLHNPMQRFGGDPAYSPTPPGPPPDHADHRIPLFVGKGALIPKMLGIGSDANAASMLPPPMLGGGIGSDAAALSRLPPRTISAKSKAKIPMPQPRPRIQQDLFQNPMVAVHPADYAAGNGGSGFGLSPAAMPILKF